MVSGMEAFIKKGGTVRLFVNEQNKICFRMNLDLTKRAGLKVSSKLIKVAELESQNGS